MFSFVTSLVVNNLNKKCLGCSKLLLLNTARSFGDPTLRLLVTLSVTHCQCHCESATAQCTGAALPLHSRRRPVAQAAQFIIRRGGFELTSTTRVTRVLHKSHRWLLRPRPAVPPPPVPPPLTPTAQLLQLKSLSPDSNVLACHLSQTQSSTKGEGARHHDDGDVLAPSLRHLMNVHRASWENSTLTLLTSFLVRPSFPDTPVQPVGGRPGAH